MKTSKTTTKYGLMMDEKLLTYYRDKNNGDCCGEYSYRLTKSYEEDSTKDAWLVDDELTAEYVRNYSTQWYNADYDTPINPFINDKDKITVVKVEVKIDTEITPVSLTLPYPEELFKAKYEKTDPEHLEFLLGIIKKGGKISLGIYDFIDYFKRIKK